MYLDCGEPSLIVVDRTMWPDCGTVVEETDLVRGDHGRDL